MEAGRKSWWLPPLLIVFIIIIIIIIIIFKWFKIINFEHFCMCFHPLEKIVT
jgi:hypothetical protein